MNTNNRKCVNMKSVKLKRRLNNNLVSQCFVSIVYFEPVYLKNDESYEKSGDIFKTVYLTNRKVNSNNQWRTTIMVFSF